MTARRLRPLLGVVVGVLLGVALFLLCAVSVNLWGIGYYGGLSVWNYLIVAPLTVFSGYLAARAYGRPGPAWQSAVTSAASVGAGVVGALILAGGPVSRTSYPMGSMVEEGALLYGIAFGVLAAGGGWLEGHTSRRSGAVNGSNAVRLVAGVVAGVPAPVAGIMLPLIAPSSLFDAFGETAWPRFVAFVGGVVAGAVVGGTVAALFAGRLEKRVAVASAVCGLAAASLAAIDSVQREGPTPYPFLALSFIVVVAPLAGLGGWLVGRARRRRGRGRR